MNYYASAKHRTLSDLRVTAASERAEELQHLTAYCVADVKDAFSYRSERIAPAKQRAI
jgi:hypothetical protein